MKKNLGTIDIIARLVISAILVVLFLTHAVSGISGIVLLIIAGVLTLTSIFSICPIYLALGISSRGKK